MTAVEMLALYGSGAAEEKNLWELALRAFPRGMRGETAGAPGVGQNAAALLPEENFARAVRTQEVGLLAGAQQREAGAETSAAQGLLRMERLAVRSPGLIGAEGSSAEGPAAGAYAGKSGGARLRESVLGVERAAISRGEALRGSGNSFGTMYAEFERRLAIELGAG